MNMSAKKTIKPGRGLTPGQWAKFGPALQASKDEQALREAPKKMALALLAKFDGVENWGEYADALRDCAADIQDMLASDEILRIPSRAEFEAEDTAADRAGAKMMAVDYRIGMMEAKYLLTVMTGLFGAYVEAKKRDPESVAGLISEMASMKAQMQSGFQATRGHVTKELSPMKADVRELSGHVLEDTGATKTIFAASPEAKAVFAREAKRELLEHFEKTGAILGVNALAKKLAALEWRKKGWPNSVRGIGQESFRKKVPEIIAEFTRDHRPHIGKTRRR